MFRFLEDYREPVPQVGELIRFVGQKWRPEYTHKTKKLTLTQPSHRTILYKPTTSTPNDGIIAPGSTITTIKLDTQLEPKNEDSIFYCRLGFPKSGLVWYLKYPEAHYSGGLDAPGYVTPVPGNPDTGYIAHITSELTPVETPLLEFWATYGGKMPALAVYNPGPDYEKVLFDVRILQCVMVDATPQEIVAYQQSGKVPWTILSEEVLRW